MVKSINIFSAEVIIFIFVFIFGTMLLILYNIFKPEPEIGYNFEPYPEFSPKNIPDIGEGSCYTKLTKCTSDGQCPSCPDDYECQYSETDGQFVINNQSTEAGQYYCLPKKDKTTDCNKYSGQWTWVNDPDFCGDKGDQCWRCMCKYPNLYASNGSVQNCSVKVGCGVPNSAESSLNKLVSTKALEIDSNGKIPAGTEWNPLVNAPDVLKYNPYDKNINGEPYFKCDCSSYGNKLVNLPGDPYKCHKNKCDVYNLVPATIDDYGNINCDCIGRQMQKIGPNSTLKGTCVGTEICKELTPQYFSYKGPIVDGNNVVLDCDCSYAKSSFSQKCISNYANTDKTACWDDFSPAQEKIGKPQCDVNNSGMLPKCKNVFNRIGIECRDNEALVNCNANNTSYKDCSSGTCKCVCKDGSNGKECDGSCLKSGTLVSTSQTMTNKLGVTTTTWIKDDASSSTCCNGYDCQTSFPFNLFTPEVGEKCTCK